MLREKDVRTDEEQPDMVRSIQRMHLVITPGRPRRSGRKYPAQRYPAGLHDTSCWQNSREKIRDCRGPSGNPGLHGE